MKAGPSLAQDATGQPLRIEVEVPVRVAAP
jgi:hypothetical protein